MKKSLLIASLLALALAACGKKEEAAPAPAEAPKAEAPAAEAPKADAAAPAEAPKAAAAAPAAAAGRDLSKAVTAPMVGTVYLSPAPGARPFIEVGSTVKEGQTLLIIEAMKTFNPIKAPKAGTVTQILVANAHPVEFGEPLMIVE